MSFLQTELAQVTHEGKLGVRRKHIADGQCGG